MGVEKGEQTLQMRSDSFFRMSMPAAIVKFLEMAKTPQSVSEVTTALLSGGFKTISKNLMPSVGSTLSRMKAAGETVNVNGKWGLASWYAAARKVEGTEKPKAKSREEDVGTKPTTQSADADTRAEGVPNPPRSPRKSRHKLTPTQEQQIKVRAEAGDTYRQLAEEFSVSRGYVWRIVSGQRATSATPDGGTPESPPSHMVRHKLEESV
jgi:chemotaxis protein histidine kinase CheA